MEVQAAASLPRVQTMGQLMDYLEDRIAAPAGGGGGLRSYVIEADGGLAPAGGASGTAWEMDGTGVDGIKILCVRRGGAAAAEFFADVSDRRFPILHSVGGPRGAKAAIDGIAELRRPSLDRMWLPHALLDAIAGDGANAFQGFGVRFAGGPAGRDGDAAGATPLEGLSLDLSGSLARGMGAYLRGGADLRDAIAYSRVRVMRGGGPAARGYVIDDVYGDGCFAVRRGRSVRDHVDLVRASRDRYARAVGAVEKCRLGARRSGGKWRFGGEPLNFEFRKKIPDVGGFVRDLFGSAGPFRLWGLESEVEGGYYSVAAADLRTGDPLNFEIADDMMRVYLNEESRGGTVTRLLCNLQARFGAGVRCRQLEEAAGG